MARIDNDRERILTNIAGMLAKELYRLQTLPAVQEYMAKDHSMCNVVCRGGWTRKGEPYPKGAIVACRTSIGLKQHPFLVSFVEQNGTPHAADGLVLRAIGTDDLCNYSNESFLEIIGIPARLLWAGEQRKFETKLYKVLRKLNTFIHRFRGIEFVGEEEADVYFGEIYGGLGAPTKPYAIRVKFNKKVPLKNIRQQLLDGGFGTREFEPENGKGSGPFRNPQPITKADIVGTLGAAGVSLSMPTKETT